MAVEVEEAKGPPTPKWIVTFTDLMSLLLTFFILLLTFSTPRVEKLYEVRGSIRGTFGIFFDSKDDRDAINEPNLAKIGRDQQNPYAPAQQPRFRPLAEHEPNKQIMALRDQSGVELDVDRIAEGYRIHIRDAVMFAPGDAIMDPESFVRLSKVAQATEFMPYHLVAVGFVGGSEMDRVQDLGLKASELAISRAVNVVRRLVRSHGANPAVMAVAGYEPTPKRYDIAGTRRIYIGR